MAITSSRAGNTHDVNKLSRAGRAQFNALGDAMRAVLGTSSSARDVRVHMRVRSARRSSNCYTRAIAHDDVASRACESLEYSYDLAVRSSLKFCWILAARDATALQYTR